MALIPPRKGDEYDLITAAASMGDARPLLKQAQRALERARRIGNKHATSEDEAAQLLAHRLLATCTLVDQAVALVEGD